MNERWLTRLLLATAVVALPLYVNANPYKTYLDGVEASYIQDGDTPAIEIRMFGIDTPEKAQLCEGRAGCCFPCGQSCGGIAHYLMSHDFREAVTGCFWRF